MATEPKTYKAWVLWYVGKDGSRTTIVRVYLDPIRAQEDFALVDSPAGQWHLDETKVVGFTPTATTVLDFFGGMKI